MEVGNFFGPKLGHPNCGDERIVFPSVSLLVGNQRGVACELPRQAGPLAEVSFSIREDNFRFGRFLKYFRVGIISITEDRGQHQLSRRRLPVNSTKEGHRNYCVVHRQFS